MPIVVVCCQRLLHCRGEVSNMRAKGPSMPMSMVGGVIVGAALLTSVLTWEGVNQYCNIPQQALLDVSQAEARLVMIQHCWPFVLSLLGLVVGAWMVICALGLNRARERGDNTEDVEVREVCYALIHAQRRLGALCAKETGSKEHKDLVDLIDLLTEILRGCCVEISISSRDASALKAFLHQVWRTNPVPW